MMNVFRKRLLASTTIASAMLAATPALAQNAEAAPPPAEAPGDSSNDIVVTGSRIPQPNLESASPVTIVGAAEIKQSGVTRVEDLVNALPQVFAGQGGTVSNGSSGTATLNLRGLGEARTLVLINGRRVVPGDPQVPFADINIIPGSIIKRVDVLTGGASSVYGADAVAGVVNFVMDTDFTGFKADGQYSFYQHQNRANGNIIGALQAQNFGYPKGSVADGGAIDASVAFGAAFDDGRGHVTAYAGYRKIDPVTQDNRDYSACTVTGLPSRATNADGIPTDSIATRGRGYNCGGSAIGFPAAFYQGSQYYDLQGAKQDGPNTYNFAPTNYYQRPDERYTAGLFANYDVADQFKPYLEFMFMDDRTIAQIAPSGNFGNTTTLNCDNPLVSAGALTSLGCVAGAGGVVPASVDAYVFRRNVEGGGRQDDLQHTDYRLVFGAKGDIAKGVSYDGYYQYGRVNFAETYRNDFSVTRLGRAIDVVSVNAAGDIVAPNAPGSSNVCRSVQDGSDPACVPYNIFQPNSVTPGALAYLQVPLFSRGQTTEQVASGSVTFQGKEYGIASPFASEGLAINIGGEYRKETVNLEFDAAFKSGDGAGQGGSGAVDIAGELRVTEGFVEASLPLVQDRPFFEELRVGGGYRRSHYTVEGVDPQVGGKAQNSFDTDTWKAEVYWTPVRDVKLRATFSRAVRAPNVQELFTSERFALDGNTDPCAGTNPSATLAQCQLTGVTAAQYGTIGANPANQYNGYLSGNAQLSPEISNSFTGGVVFTPSFLPRFQATIDYFNIRLKNQISTYGADSILQSCINTADPFYCNLIKRSTTGSLFRPSAPTEASGGYVTDFNVNAGKLSTKGIDVTLAYTQDVGRFGSIGLNMVGTWLDELINDPFGDPGFNCSGYFGPQCSVAPQGPNPEWRHKARFTYTTPWGPSITTAWRYFSAVKNEAFSPDPDLAGTPPSVTPATATTPEILNPGSPGLFPGNARFDAQSYFDLAVTAPVGDIFTFRIGANNILDRQPPLQGQGFGNGNAYSQTYDSLGRYIYAGVTLDF